MKHEAIHVSLYVMWLKLAHNLGLIRWIWCIIVFKATGSYVHMTDLWTLKSRSVLSLEF
jgi:hypothetical protein